MTAPATVLQATPDLENVARKLLWWKEPAEALRDPVRFVAQVMALGTWSDVQTVDAVLGRDSFRRVLDDPPAGVLDEASWYYWHNALGMQPIPPLPKRRLP